MAGTIQLGTVTIATEVAERRLASLERELGRTVDRSKGLETALKEASEAVKAQRDALNGLGTAAKRAADEAARLAEQEKREAAEAEKLAEKQKKVAEQQRKVAEETNSLERVWQRLGQTAQASQQTLDNNQRSLTQTAFSFNQVSQALRTAWSGLQHFGEGVSWIERHNRVVSQLGPAYQLVERATNGAVSAEQAFAAQGRITRSGLRLTNEELATFMRAAREHAVRTNGEVQQSIEQLTDALVQGEAGGLRRFGVAVREGSSRAQVFEAALRRFNQEQRNTAPLARTTAENIEALGRGAREAGSAVVTFLSNATGLGPWLQGVVRDAVGALNSLRDFFQFLESRRAGREADARQGMREDAGMQAAGNIDRDAERLGIRDAASGTAIRNALRTLQGPRREAFIRALQERQQQAPRLDVRADGSTARLGRDAQSFDLGGMSATEARAALSSAFSGQDGGYFASESAQRTSLARNISELRQTAERLMREQADEANRGPGTRDPNRVGVQNQNQDELRRAQDRYNRALAGVGLSEGIFEEGRYVSPEAVIARRGGRDRRPGETEAQRLERVAGVLEDIAQRITEQDTGDRTARTEQARSRRGALDDADETRNRRETSRKDNERRDRERSDAEATTRKAAEDQQLLGTQVANAWELSADRTVNASQMMAQGVRGAFNAMSSAASSHFQALITGRETAGEAFAGMAKDALSSIATESFTRALFETAQGFAALATYRYPEAGQHFIAAGIFGAIAGGAGAATYALSAGQNNASAATSSGRSSPSARGSNPVDRGGGGGDVTYIINVESALATQHSVQDELTRAESGAFRRGVANEQQRRARQAATT